MPDLYTQGLLTPYPWLAVEPKTQFGVAQQWYVKRTPLTSRLPSLPVGNRTFNMVKWGFRSRTVTLTADPSTTSPITLADASILMNGDRLQTSTGEVMEVIADPNITANTVAVRRGAASTTPTAIASGSGGAWIVYNLGNSRTGGEKNQSALQRIPSTTPQNVQTFQHVVQVSGIVQAIGGNYPLPSATPTPFAKNKMDALQNIMDDIEVDSLFGVKEDLSASVLRPTQAGLFNLITTNAITSPTSASAYKPSDFIKDVLSPIRANGGEPSLIMVSNGFMAGLAQWGIPLQRLTAGATMFGVDIQYFVCSFLGDIPIVENMWLNRYPNSALVLGQEECRFRTLEELDYKPYARIGDTGTAGEGDWIARLAIELDNEEHHATLKNVTGFAVQT